MLGATVAKLRALASARRRARRPGRQRGRGGPARANCRVRLPRGAPRRARAPLRVGARARARAPAAPGRGARSHVPDLRGARGAARAAAAASRCSSGSRTGAAAGSSQTAERLSTSRPERRRADVPARLAQARRDRSRHRRLRPPVRRARRAAAADPARARPDVSGEGPRDDRPGGGQVPDVELLVIGPSLTRRSALHKIALERLVIDLGLLDRVDIRGPVAAPYRRRPLRRGRRARQRHASGGDRQGRLRGGGDLHAGARVEPGVRHAAPTGAPFRHGDVDGAGGGDPGACRSSTGTRSADASGDRRPRALGRGVGRPGLELAG